MNVTTERLGQWLRQAAAPFAALATFVVAVTGAFKWLRPALEELGAPAGLAAATCILLPMLAGGLALWTTRQVVTVESRLLRKGRFDLKVRGPSDLLGRAQDVEDLRVLTLANSVVLLDGESGSGKSSLIAFGLVEALKAHRDRLPVLVPEYRGDWDFGLTECAYRALCGALTDAQIARLDLQIPGPARGQDPSIFAELVNAVFEKLALRPLLLLDQFDDYQLAHRRFFLDSQQAWISAERLVEANGFWRAVAELTRAGRLDLLIVTRSDATAGLNSVRLAEPLVQRTLLRLERTVLGELIARAVLDDKQGEVIADPDAGWAALAKVLEKDLARAGAVLPQQVRLTFKGLTRLPGLTPARYEQAGRAQGLEILYLRDAIGRAAAACGAEPSQIRGILGMMVEREAGDQPKTRRATEGEMRPRLAAEGALEKALEQLVLDEIVRESPGPDGSGWQLDHDYLARTVVAEERSANALALRLREGEDAWQAAGANPIKRFNRLLPVVDQWRLARARLGGAQPFRYGPQRRYAIYSLLRVVPAVLALALAGVGARDATLRADAREIVDRLDAQRGAPAVMTLWSAPKAVRTRVRDQLFASPGRLVAAGSDWAAAYVSLDTEAARALVKQLTPKLDAADADANRQGALIEAIGVAGRRLPSAEARGLFENLAASETFEKLDGKRAGAMSRALESLTRGMARADAQALIRKFKPLASAQDGATRQEAVLADAMADLYVRAGTAEAAALLRNAFGGPRDMAIARLVRVETLAEAAMRVSAADALQFLRIMLARGGDPLNSSFYRGLGPVLAERLTEAEAQAFAADVDAVRVQRGPFWQRRYASAALILGSAAPAERIPTMVATLRAIVVDEAAPPDTRRLAAIALRQRASAMSPADRMASLAAIEGIPRKAEVNTDAYQFEQELPTVERALKRAHATGSGAVAAPPASGRALDRARNEAQRLKALDNPAALGEASMNDVGRLAALLPPAEGRALLAHLAPALTDDSSSGETYMAVVDASVPLAREILKHDPKDPWALRALLQSIAAPHRDPTESPGWAVLDEVAGKPFERDTARLAAWAESQLGSDWGAGRPARQSARDARPKPNAPPATPKRAIPS